MAVGMTRNCEGMAVVATLVLVLPCWRYAHGVDAGKRNVETGGNRTCQSLTPPLPLPTTHTQKRDDG